MSDPAAVPSEPHLPDEPAAGRIGSLDHDAKLVGVELTRLTLSDQDARAVTLDASRLLDCDLSCSRLESLRLLDCDVQRCNLANLTARGAHARRVAVADC